MSKERSELVNFSVIEYNLLKMKRALGNHMPDDSEKQWAFHYLDLVEREIKLSKERYEKEVSKAKRP